MYIDNIINIIYPFIVNFSDNGSVFARQSKQAHRSQCLVPSAPWFGSRINQPILKVRYCITRPSSQNVQQTEYTFSNLLGLVGGKTNAKKD